MHKHLFRTQNEIMDQRPSSVLSMQGPSAQTRLLSVTCHHPKRGDPPPSCRNAHLSYSVMFKCVNSPRMTGGQSPTSLLMI